MQTGRILTNDKMFIGGFLLNYLSDYNTRFGIVHTWKWHDIYNPPDLTSY